MAHDFRSSPNARGKGPRDAYLVDFQNHAKLRLERGKHFRMHKLDRDDIAADMTVRVLLNVDDYRRRYPQPEKLARVMLDQAVVGYQRKQGAQQGRGARFGREAVYFDDLTTDPTSSWDHDSVGEAEVIDEAVRLCGMLDAALIGQGVSARNRELLWLVLGEGITVTEAADRVGVRRETAGRILKKVVAAAKAQAAQWKADGISYPHRDA
jgi:DNA-directed RNA polymerase specialized sigma24 family protein